MGASFGKKITTTVFGESHGDSIGVVIDGMPLGEKIDFEELIDFLDRRAPGRNKFLTQRFEEDTPKFISGVKNNTIVSNTICAVIKNKDYKSSDYIQFKDIPRPSHADFVSYIKYKGKMDMDGSGPFSGRLTAPLCISGGIAKQILEKRGIQICARIKNLGGIEDEKINFVKPNMSKLKECIKKDIPVVSDEARVKMEKLLEDIREEKNSIGAEIECFVTGTEIGLGNPNYDGFESVLSKGIFSIPGIRGLSFGTGFECINMKGSEHNDEFEVSNGLVKTITNHAGGIVGGITNGMPIVFSVAVKPTPSIGIKQKSFSITDNKQKDLIIEGRHDPCIAIRMVAVIEAVCALVILDFMEQEI